MLFPARPRLIVIVTLTLASACAQHAATPAEPQSAPAMEEQGAPGYGQPPAQPPPPPTGSLQPGSKADLTRDDDRAFGSIAEAEEELARAQAALAELDADGSKKPSNAQPKAAGPPAKPATARPLDTGDNRCESACKAFASLKRAADGICRLAGDTDTRCSRAREIVKQNEPRVAACKCEESSQ